MGRVGRMRGNALVCAITFALVVAGFGIPSGLALAPETSAERVGVRVPVLAYHGVDYSGSIYSVTPEQLDEQCRWLVENGFTVITVWQFWDAVTGVGTLPPLPVILTVDDGLPSTLAFADVLARYGMSGSYFVNSESHLTPDQIYSLAQRGAVQAHTASHASLLGLDFDSQLAEITHNVAHLEQITGQSVRFLAWPFGDSDASAVQAASAAGIIGAFGLGGTAANTGAIDPYYIPRIMMTSDDDLATFAAKVTSW